MQTVGGLALALSLAAGADSALGAGKDADALEGARLSAVIEPEVGFVDSPLALDSEGAELAFIVSDAAGRSEVHVRELASGKTAPPISLAGLKGVPVAIAFVADDSLLVTAERAAGDQVGAVFRRRDGKLTRRFGPATRVAKASYGGAEVVAIYNRRKRSGAATVHSVEARSPLTGKRIGKKTVLVVDASGVDKKRGFVLETWQDEHLTAVGIAVGQYDKKADQRMPNRAGRLDMVSGALAATAIPDLIAHRRQSDIAARHPNEARFIELARDRKSLRLFEGGTQREIRLAEPFNHYEPASLAVREGPGGSLYFALQIDPVHPDAAAAKRAVRDWIDLYELRPGKSLAVRRARLHPQKRSAMRWLAGPSHWILVRQHVGFSRGGPRLEILELTP